MKLWAWMSAVLLTCALCGAENLIKNGDFANGGKNWNSAQYKGGKKFHTFEDGKLLVSGNPESKFNKFATLVQALDKLDPQQDYLLTATLEVNAVHEEGKAMWIRVREANAEGKTIRYAGFNIDLKKQGPAKYAARIRPTAQAASFTMYIAGLNLGADDRISVGEVKLVPVEAAKPVAGNLVQNGDFSNPALLPWRPSTRKVKNEPFEVIADPETGKGVLQVNGDPENKRASFMTMIQPLPELKAGQKYRLSANFSAGLAAPKGKSVSVRVREIDADGKSIGYVGVIAWLSRKGWLEQTKEFTPNPKAVKFQLYITSCNLADGDTVLVRDIVLVPVE